jgi:hypothetical protein
LSRLAAFRDLATLLLASTALFEQGVAALRAMAPANPLVFSLAWVGELAILGVLYFALGGREECA